MKLTKLFLIIALNLISFRSFCQDELKKWDKTDLITWADFKLEPDLGNHFSALSYTGITYKYKYITKNDTVKIDFIVYAYFNPEKSWSKINKQSKDLLEHEQLHFDIAELYSRILLEKSKAQPYSKNNFQEEIKLIFAYYYQDMRNFQANYDEETNHMLNRTKQKEWENNIKTELAKTIPVTNSQ